MANDGDRPQSDDIDLSLDDLDEEPLPPAPAVSAPAGDMLVITGDDLLEVSDEPPPAAYPSAAAPGAYPGVEGGAYANLPKGKKGIVPALVGSMLLHMLIAGAIGGFLAWAINEPLTTDQAGRATASEVFLSSLIFFAITGGAIGLFLGGVEGVSSANMRKAAIGGAIGLGIGAVGGGLAGILGQAAYGILGGRGDQLTILQMFARTVGWTIAGIFVGLGQGVSGRSFKKIINGIVGGAIGGFIGGMLFDPIGVVFALSASNPGLVSRLVALVVIGAASGAAIGLIEELRKEAWLVITGGPLTGKQFILYNAMTTIGSSPKCDIALLKDQSIAPQHCVIEVSGPQHTIRDLGTQTGTAVNGRPVQRQPLRRGDIIQIGQTTLEYQDRAVG
jgi:hypothetical protein